MIDDLTALRLQLEWGADEAIADVASDRFQVAPRAPAELELRAAAEPGPRTMTQPDLRATARRPAPPPPRPAPALGIPARARALADAAADLATLRATFENFDGCPLRDTAGAFVFASGPETARLLIVAEAPDVADDASGEPLSGEAGRFLDRMLAAAGIERAACRVVTLVPWRPPGGRPPNAGEIAACTPFLERHLALLQFDHAILLGACVARVLVGAAGTIRQLRGSWHELAVGGRTSVAQALVMVPPAQIMTDSKSKKNSWADLLMLRERTDKISSR